MGNLVKNNEEIVVSITYIVYSAMMAIGPIGLIKLRQLDYWT